jgi:hypothetical protein
VDAIAEANEHLRAKGYAERDLGVFPAPKGKALLKGGRIVSPMSDEAATVLRLVRDVIPPAGELGKKTLRPAELRALL